jgi:hypothetical protein
MIRQRKQRHASDVPLGCRYCCCDSGRSGFHSQENVGDAATVGISAIGFTPHAASEVYLMFHMQM